HEHPQELSDLVDVVAGLPLGDGSGDDLARSHGGIERARRLAAPVAHRADDTEVAKLQMRPVAHEDVHRGQIAMEELAAVELPEDFQDPCDLAPRRALGPRSARALEERAEVAVPRVLEGEVVERALVRLRHHEPVEDADRPRVSLEKLAEVGFAYPRVQVRAD